MTPATRQKLKADSADRLGMESLENRSPLAVMSSLPAVAVRGEVTAATAPTIQLCECSDTGAKGDGLTNAMTPRFVGTAPPRATVTLALEGGATLGSVKTNTRGAWAFNVRRGSIGEGTQVIRAATRDPSGVETSASTTVTFDRQAPTASIEITGLVSFRVTFSRPVTGFTDRLRGLHFSGQPTGEPAVNLPFTSARLRSFIGRVEFTASPDGRVYDVQLPECPVQSGTFSLRLVAAQSGVVDAVSGNRLVTNAVSATQTVP